MNGTAADTICLNITGNPTARQENTAGKTQTSGVDKNAEDDILLKAMK